MNTITETFSQNIRHNVGMLILLLTNGYLLGFKSYKKLACEMPDMETLRQVNQALVKVGTWCDTKLEVCQEYVDTTISRSPEALQELLSKLCADTDYLLVDIFDNRYSAPQQHPCGWVFFNTRSTDSSEAYTLNLAGWSYRCIDLLNHGPKDLPYRPYSGQALPGIHWVKMCAAWPTTFSELESHWDFRKDISRDISRDITRDYTAPEILKIIDLACFYNNSNRSVCEGTFTEYRITHQIHEMLQQAASLFGATLPESSNAALPRLDDIKLPEDGATPDTAA